jgi:putative PIN family toxin of toxin-antitoxin system
MRVVVDTNVFVSAALKVGSLPAIALRLVARYHVLLKSAPTEQQLFPVLTRPSLAPLIASAAHEWITELLVMAECVAITGRIVACRDPTDDKFLELAVSGNADLIPAALWDDRSLRACRHDDPRVKRPGAGSGRHPRLPAAACCKAVDADLRRHDAEGGAEESARRAAGIILSGDKDLLALHPFRGIPIVAPATFVPCS